MTIFVIMIRFFVDTIAKSLLDRLESSGMSPFSEWSTRLCVMEWLPHRRRSLLYNFRSFFDKACRRSFLFSSLFALIKRWGATGTKCARQAHSSSSSQDQSGPQTVLFYERILLFLVFPSVNRQILPGVTWDSIFSWHKD